MIHTKEISPEQSLGREVLDIAQDAISPNWLMRVIKGTTLILFILIVLAFVI